MDNAFDEITKAIEQAKAVDSVCNRNANAMLEILIGRLRHCRPWNLAKLKRELRDFNIHTKQWQNK